MSVEHIKGNLLDFPSGINVIAHSCNGRGVMGSGIAKSIREEYPCAYEVYQNEFEKNGLQLGTMTVAVTPSGKRIVNMITQESYGNDETIRYVDYEAFYVALKVLRDSLEAAQKEGRNYVLGLPYKISSDRARGDWRIISCMIHSLFDDSPVRCVLVERVLPKIQPLDPNLKIEIPTITPTVEPS